MDSNEDIICDFYEHIVSDNLLGHLEDFVSEDCTVWADGQSKKVGVNGMKEHLEAIRHTYPDYRMRILRQFVSGDYVISEFRMEGTFQNEWLGINPAGEKLSITVSIFSWYSSCCPGVSSKSKIISHILMINCR